MLVEPPSGLPGGDRRAPTGRRGGLQELRHAGQQRQPVEAGARPSPDQLLERRQVEPDVPPVEHRRPRRLVVRAGRPEQVADGGEVGHDAVPVDHLEQRRRVEALGVDHQAVEVEDQRALRGHPSILHRSRHVQHREAVTTVPGTDGAYSRPVALASR